MSNLESTLTFNKEEGSLKEFIIKESGIRKYIVDASVAIKWYYKEGEKDLNNAESLYGLLRSDKDMLMAPELLIYEVLNTLRLKKDISLDDANGIISNLYQILLFLDMDKELLEKAFEHSRELDISFYDSTYVTFAERYDAPLITADIKLFKAGQNMPRKPLLLADLENITNNH